MHVQTADGVQVIDTSPPCSGCESPPHCQLQIGCTVTLTHDLHTQQKATIFTTRLSAKPHRSWLAASALLTSTPSSCREQLSFGKWLSSLLFPRASCKRSTHAHVKTVFAATQQRVCRHAHGSGDRASAPRALQRTLWPGLI